jgi:hypothetical protein
VKQVRLAQAIALVLYGHDEAPHPIAPTLTREEVTHDDVRGVMHFVSERAAAEASAHELGILDLGGEGG